MGLYAFKDNEMYKGNQLNCLTIPNVDISTRFLKIEVKFLLITTLPHHKYKEPTDDMAILPLIFTSPSLLQLPSEKTLKSLKKFDFEAKHITGGNERPPSKYGQSSGDQFKRYIYEVHEFSIVKLDQIKKEYSEAVEKITTNIMDEGIVRDCLNNVKISNY